MTRNIFPEWVSDNQHSRFPFSDSSTLVSDSGKSIDKDIILDLVIYLIGAEPPIFLSSIEGDGAVSYIRFSGLNGVQCSGSWVPGSSGTSVALYDDYDRPAGLVVLSDLGKTILGGWIGTYDFQADSAEVVSTCVIPQPQLGLRGFQLSDGELISGDVVLVGGRGVWLSDSLGVLRVDVTGDFGQFKEKCSEIVPYASLKPIKTINGQQPDEYGNFLIVPSDANGNKPVFRIRLEQPNTITITSISNF